MGLDLHQRLYSKVLGKRSSSSKKTLLKVHLPAVGNSLKESSDRRIEGIAHDVIMKDEERMGRIQEVVQNDEMLMQIL